MIDESHHEILFYDGKKTFMAIEKKESRMDHYFGLQRKT